MNKTILIKAGGSILHEEERITLLCDDIKSLKEAGYKIILVHGGGKAINEALTIHDIPSEFIDGLRVTSSAAIKVIEMVLCGQVNQRLVRKLNHLGMDAIGLSGAEHKMLLCDYHSQKHGFVGDIQAVNPFFLNHILTSLDLMPVIASIGIDRDGNALNINADMAACHLANSLGVDQLIYLTDQDGIYNAQGKIFSSLSEQNLQQLISHSIVEGGMLVKVKAILASLKAGLKGIMVLNGKQNQILLDAVLHNKGVGTLCSN
ncbi:MAG: acetylglutamate kinase [Tatlockia sp.]|nr:acetylglutamate kinase [Tatlockia sp.]